MYPPSIQKLIEFFSSFPTVGPRTAARFVFYLLRAPKTEVEELVKAINSLKENIQLCEFCFKPFEDSKKEKLCEICRDSQREKTVLCVIEKESDLETIEKTKLYRGLYFILGGTVGTLRKEDISKLRVKELVQRLQSTRFKECIIATNPTLEGDATALYLQRVLKEKKVKLTKLGRGLPIGGELEYADDETLRNALEGRR